MRRCTHFVGFRGEEYLSAVRTFGPPDFIHRGWDMRARREIADGDLVVFAHGHADQEPNRKSFDDIREYAWPSRSPARSPTIELPARATSPHEQMHSG